jgi:hypothetical protein
LVRNIMSAPNESATNGLGRGCLIALAVAMAFVVGIVTLISSRQKAANPDFERKKAGWRTESFQKVKAGDDGNGIFVYLDPRLIEMLANDADCVANLATLILNMADLSGPQTASAGRLVNVKKVVFYDCAAAGNLLTAMKGLGSIEEIAFDTTQLSDADVRLLATFPNLKRVHFAWVNDPSREKLLRDTLPGVEIQIDESGP